ncbi:MAG: cytochrome c oxidase accessory protein CcoG [Candidatus Sericytochromatia bacterium]|nr:MAG: cytochrome c oxidase accessory protein CcoG [Candidatus Sericytochromatia bacterium]
MLLQSLRDKKIIGNYNITKKRRIVQSSFLLLYFLFPLLNIFYIDIENRTFILIGKTIDISNSIIFLVAFIILLFFVIGMSIVSGRSFCGWICPQNFLSEMINKFLVNKKSKLNNTFAILFSLVFSLLVSINFMFYFGKRRDIFNQIVNFSLNNNILIFSIFFFLLVFLGIGVFRHDFCKYACPYGIMQASISDKTTLRVRFEKERSKDCIDCNLCKNICYMGIEPRKLYQNEPGCVNCGLCIEECQKVLAPLNRKSMLTFSSVKSGYGKDLINNKGLFIISIMLFSFIVYFLYLFIYLPDINIVVSRDENVVSILDENNNINSRFIVSLLNQSSKEKNIFLKVENISNEYISVIPNNIKINPGERYITYIIFKAPKNSMKKGINKFDIKVVDKENYREINKTYNSIFIPFE